MRNLLWVLLVVGLVVGCQKTEQNIGPLQTEVAFNILQVDSADNDLKTGFSWTCLTDEYGNLLQPDHAEIDVFDGTKTTTFTPAVFRLDGKLYTQTIKLPAYESGPTVYKVTRFVIKDATDKIIMATPESGSDYAKYVTKTVDFEFHVNVFTKEEVNTEVLCFLPRDYERFGFYWFGITQIVVRQFCFYGDICLNGDPYSPDDYLNSPYDHLQQPEGTQADMPAIMKIHIYNNGVEVPYSPFTNATADDGYGNGNPLCVLYPDKLGIDGEAFTFDVYVLVKNAGGSFSYQLYHTFTSTDGGPLDVDNGGDGILDFVIGSCGISSDLQLDWADPVENIVVRKGDLAGESPDILSDPSRWFFWNDNTNEIDSTLGSFVEGPDSPLSGEGSAQISVSSDEITALATDQFAGIPLGDITTLAFSTYNPSAENNGEDPLSGYLCLNVVFDGINDTASSWHNRLIYEPPASDVEQATWQEWDALNGGDALWKWSGYAENENEWPDGKQAVFRTWSEIMTAFPNAIISVNYPFVGVLAGKPSTGGYTENIDVFKFGTGSTFITYDFEN